MWHNYSIIVTNVLDTLHVYNVIYYYYFGIAKYLQVPTDYNFILCSAAVYRVMYAPRSYRSSHLDRGSSGFPSGPVPVWTICISWAYSTSLVLYYKVAGILGTLETRGGDYRGPVNFDWRKNATEMTARQ